MWIDRVRFRVLNLLSEVPVTARGLAPPPTPRALKASVNVLDTSASVMKPKARRLVMVLLIVCHVQRNSQGCHRSIELSVV